jgi:hypothetical protein
MTEIGDCAMNKRFAPVFLFAGTLLSACSGSGGNSAMNPIAFTSFSAVQNGQPVIANGMSQSMNVATTPVGVVLSTAVGGVDSVNSTAQVTYSGIGTLPVVTAFSFSTPTSSPSFSGATVTCGVGTGLCSATNANSLGVVMNPLDPPTPPTAWNYQSFGYWLVVGSATSTVAGAMSFGSPTPTVSLPTSGTATYTGVSGGTYVDPTGAVFIHQAQMFAGADFGARTVTFRTSGTLTAPVLGLAMPAPGAFTANPSLNIIQTTTPPYLAGTNQFSGTVQAPGAVGTIVTPTLSGTMTGRFYGPGIGATVTPAEIGGVFFLKAAVGPETMLGAFGGKQP